MPRVLWFRGGVLWSCLKRYGLGLEHYGLGLEHYGLGLECYGLGLECYSHANSLTLMA